MDQINVKKLPAAPNNRIKTYQAVGVIQENQAREATHRELERRRRTIFLGFSRRK